MLVTFYNSEMISLIFILISSCFVQDYNSSTLHIICDPGCEVSLNYEQAKVSSAEENGVIYRNVESGKYVVSVKKAGFLSDIFVAEVGVEDSFVRKIKLRKNNTVLNIRTIPSECEITCDCDQLTMKKSEHTFSVDSVAEGQHNLSVSWGEKSCDVKLNIEVDTHYYLSVDLLTGSAEPSHTLEIHAASLPEDTRWKILDTKDGVPIKVLDSLTGITFLYVSGGEFEMGGYSATKSSDARPVHKVTLNDFYMAETELTQEQWLTLMEFNPSGTAGNLLPVSGISYKDCYDYLSLAGHGMRLPTEAEWEYSCRAGTKGKYHCDNAQLDDFAWHYENSDGRPHRVAKKSPNPWGFYDMHGNVMEWCSDLYSKKYYEKSPADNPKGPRRGMGVYGPVMRGGSWYHGIQSTGLRSFDRYHGSRQFLQLEGSAELNSRGHILFATESLVGMRPVISAPIF